MSLECSTVRAALGVHLLTLSIGDSRSGPGRDGTRLSGVHGRPGDRGLQRQALPRRTAHGSWHRTGACRAAWPPRACGPRAPVRPAGGRVRCGVESTRGRAAAEAGRPTRSLNELYRQRCIG